MNSSNTSQIQPNSTGEPESSGSTSGIAGAKQRIKATARETVDQVKNAAASTLNRAKEETGKLAADRKRAAAERIGGYSSAIHDSAKSLEEKDPNIAWFTHRAADRLQGVADYVRDRDFTELRRDAENVARRHPAAFFGGLFVAGLLVGNLLKASAGASSSGRSAKNLGSDDATSDGGEASGSMANQGEGEGCACADEGPSEQGGTDIENQATT